MVDIVLKSMDHKLLDVTTKVIVSRFIEGGYTVKGPVMLPSRMKKWTLLASPQAHKNARVQLEARFSKRFIRIYGGGSNSQDIPTILGSCNVREEVGILIR